MASKVVVPTETVDNLLKALQTLCRTADHVLADRVAEAVTDVPLSRSKTQVIRLLGNQGRQSAGQVARFLGVSNPAVSQIIDSLVKSKLVDRRTASRDRREVELALTAAGRELFQAIRRRQRHLMRNALRLALGDAEQLTEILRETTVAVAKADRAFERFCMQCGAHANGTCVLTGGSAQCPFLRSIGRARGRSAGRRSR